MSAARDDILGGIRRALGRDSRDEALSGDPAARLAAHRRGTIPGRVARPHRDLVALFVAQARAVNATVDRVASAADVPDAVAEYLAAENLPASLKVAPDPRLQDVPWSKRPTLTVTEGKTEGQDEVSVTAAFAGIAETGTLMLHSGPESPTTLNFLPDTHIVVLRAGQVVGPYEDAWARLRQARPDGLAGGAARDFPRTVNLITGPSRTADIEQTVQLGAHGPRRLHIVLIEDDGVENGAENGEGGPDGG